MPRIVSTEFRRAAEARESGDVFLEFIRISHDALSDDIRCVNDIVDFMYAGELYAGCPFSLSLLTDTDQPPRAKITVQNVDRRIGEAIQAIDDAPNLEILVMSSADFDLSVKPRTPIGTPTVEYAARFLRLENVEVDAMTVSADIASWDFTQEPWPAIRATKGRLPGLFR